MPPAFRPSRPRLFPPLAESTTVCSRVPTNSRAPGGRMPTSPPIGSQDSERQGALEPMKVLFPSFPTFVVSRRCTPSVSNTLGAFPCNSGTQSSSDSLRASPSICRSHRPATSSSRPRCSGSTSRDQERDRCVPHHRAGRRDPRGAGFVSHAVLQMIRGVLGRDPAGFRLALNLLIAFLPRRSSGCCSRSTSSGCSSAPRRRVRARRGRVYMIALEAWRQGKFSTVAPPTPRSASTNSHRGALVIGLMQCVAMWPRDAAR